VKFAKSKPIVDEIKSDRTAVEDILKNTQHAVHINDDKEEESKEVTDQIGIRKSPEKKKNNLLKYILIFVTVFVIGIGMAGYFGYSYIKDKFIGNTTSEMMNKEWYTSSYGSPSINIETPEILQAQNVELPDNLKPIISDIITYNYGSLISNFYVEVTSTSFVNDLQNFDFDTGLQGALTQIAQKVGTKFTDVEQEIRINNGIEGRIITANYELTNPVTKELNKNKLTMLLFADSKNIRQVIITQLATDEKAEIVSERILKSVSLNP